MKYNKTWKVQNILSWDKLCYILKRKGEKIF